MEDSCDTYRNKSNILIKKYVSIYNIILEYKFNYLLVFILSINLYLINHYIDKLEKIDINYECVKYLDNFNNNCLDYYQYLLNKLIFGKKTIIIIFYSNLIIILVGISIKFTFGTNTFKKNIYKLFTKLSLYNDDNLLIENINFISNNILTTFNVIHYLLYYFPSMYYYNILFFINDTIIKKFNYHNDIEFYIAIIIFNEIIIVMFISLLIIMFLVKLYYIISSNKLIVNKINLINNLINNLLKIEVGFIDSDELNFNEKIV